MDHAGGADVEVLHRRRRLPAVPLVGRPERVGVVGRVDIGHDAADRVVDRAVVPRRVGQRLERLRPVEHERHSKLPKCPTSSTSSRSSPPSRARPERNAPSPTRSPAIYATARSTSRRTTPRRRSAGRSATSTRASRAPRRARRSSSARTSTRCRRPGGSSRSSTTRASCATPRGRSSAPTTRPAIAVMLEATRRVLSERRPHAGIELLFTPKEEIGLHGARAFDESTARRAHRVRLRPGRADRRRRSSARRIRQVLDVTFHGRAAHAGMHPEEGRNAIAAAARAIADLRLGQVDEQSTANVGVIEGGVAVNIVPDHCRFVGEARSHDEAKPRGARAGDARIDLVRRRDERVPCRRRVAQVVPRLPLQARATTSCVSRATRSRERERGAELHPQRRRRGREHLQRARPSVPQPRERHDRHPHAGRADRRSRISRRWST